MAGKNHNLENKDYDEITQFVKEQLPTWKDVDPLQIEIKEVSGLGGRKTFHVSVCKEASVLSSEDDVIPAAVVLQIISSTVGTPKKNLSQLHERTMAAGRAFASAGIGPRLIAEDDADVKNPWCIHEWAGEAIVEKFMGPGCESEATGVIAVENMKIWSHGPEEFRWAVGHLLGMVHRVPATWAESFSIPFLLSDKFPTLGCLGTDVLKTGILDGMSELMLGRWESAIDGLRTSHALAQNIVTLHADFHSGNILVNKENGRLVAIDFEFANIGQAEFDLGYAFVVNKALLNNASNKRAFVKGYVKGVTAAGASISGSDHRAYTSENDIENLLVDCEIASVKSWPPGEFIGVPDSIDTVVTFEALVKRLSEFCSLARVPEDGESSSKEKMHAATIKREELLNKGAFALIREWHNDARGAPD